MPRWSNPVNAGATNLFQARLGHFLYKELTQLLRLPDKCEW